MSILRDLFEAVGLQAVSAHAPHDLKISDPRAAHFFAGGAAFSVPKPPAPRDHAVGSITDVVELANRFQEEAAYRPAVWYGHDHVTLVIDDANADCTAAARVERATLRLEQSDLFKVLAALAAQPSAGGFHEHKAFIRLLRVTLAGAEGAEKLLAVVRRVTFANGSTSTSEKRHQRESLGREVLSECRTAEEVPEEVVVAVPFWKPPGLSDPFRVRCTVEVESTDESFRLRPFPDEVARVTESACVALGGRLCELLNDGIPVYHGKP